jgi:hypothetical protein
MRLLEGSLSGDGAVPASEDVVEGEFYEQRDPPRDPNGP